MGIDVSGYQGSGINWSSVKSSGVSFAWAKATEGVGFTDADFTINEANAKAVGVLIGAYHFARFDLNTGTTGAANEAAYFWSVAKNYIKGGASYLMPMLDAEASTTGYTKTTLSQWVNQWCLTVSNNAAASGVTVRPVIYASSSFASSWFDSSVTQWTPWIANWNGQNPQTGAPGSSSPWSTWTVWQYSDAVSVPGAGTVDGDVFNGTQASLGNIVIGGLGNYATPISSSVPSGVVTGHTFTASITMNNNGSTVWTNTGANPYRLGSQNPQDNSAWGLNRVALPTSPVNVDQNVTFTFTATAPMTAGSYAFSWKLVQEGVQWFGDTFTTYVNVVVPGPGTNFGNYTIDTGNMDSTSRSSSYVALNVCGLPGWYSYGIPETGSNCTVFNRDIRWMPALSTYGFTGRGYLTASTIISSSNATATANFFAVDAAGNDLAGPISGSVNECAYGCANGFITFFSGPVNVTSFGGWRSNTQNDGPGSGGCSIACGTFPVAYSQMHIQAARWQYMDDWTCVGPYASAGVSDTANRTFSESGLYLYPAVDTSHGNVIAAAMGLNGIVPGRVSTGDCNNSNSLNFGGANNGVSPAGNAAAYGNTNNADSYGFAWVFAPAGASPQIVIGSDDGNRFWVNGVLKNDTNAVRGLTRDQDNTGAVTLPAGWSRILFKIHNVTGGFEGTVSLRNGSNVNLNEPSVNYYDLGGYYSYGLGYEQDAWYPQIVVSNFDGITNPAIGAAVYTNDTTVTASGSSNGQGPVPYWRTMQYAWGYGLGNTDSNYADVSGIPTAAAWSHMVGGVTGHRRLLFFAVSKSGRTSFQNSGSSGGSVFQDAGSYARYYDVYVDNVAPLNPSFSSVSPGSTHVALNWTIPLDQGVNVAPGETESAGAGGNQDAQNWYLVGDVGAQVYRDGAVISSWGTATSADDTGLTPNTPHTYAIEARDNNSQSRGHWSNATGSQGSNVIWTLSLPPGPSTVAASPTNPIVGSSVTWTAVGGFGPGTVQYYRYVWDQSATHTFSDSEAQWSSNSITTVASSAGDWYLHLKSYNGADVGNGTYDFLVHASQPQMPEILSIAALGGTVNLTWSAASGSVYRAQYTPDLSAMNWSNLVPDVVATNSTASASDNAGAAVQRFYRVVLLP